jgi:hypothetical protein
MNRRVYFAYGSNMIKNQMKSRCPGSELIGIAILAGYRFLINSRGVATIVKDPASRVYGMLWSISIENERALDFYEGVSSGLYAKNQVNVIPATAEGEPVPAMVYIASDNKPGATRAGYLSAIIHAAERYGYPEEYVLELKRLE